MSKRVEAEYLAEERILKLARPLDGLADHERVHVIIEQHATTERNDWPKLDEEAGRELARALRAV
jgi:hypothetical protein